MSSPNERAAQLAQQADAALQAGDLSSAKTAITEAVMLREDSPDYHLLQGTIDMRSGNPVDAYRSFNRALEFDATNRTALAFVGNIGVQIGQISEAEEAADKLLTLEPNALPALQVKGMIALSRDKLEEAIILGDRILAINPTDEAGAIVKARALAKQGKPEEALKLIDRAMTTSPDSIVLLTNKVNIFRHLGQKEAMVEPLAELVRMTNGTPSYRLDQTNLLYRLDRIDEARRAGLPLLVMGSRKSEDYRLLHRLWWEFDKSPLPPGGARNTSAWKDPMAVVTTVRYFFQRGDLATVGELIRTAPRNVQPLLASSKARLLAASGRVPEAKVQVESLLAADDHDVDALLLKAQFDQQDRKFQSALEAAQLAQTNDPQNPETYTTLAAVYVARGTAWRARQIFEQGLKALPQNFYLIEAYTQYLHQSGDKARAVSAARAFARALPSSERAWALMVAQCERAGDAACLRSADMGFQNAKKTVLVDETPGAVPNRGLFGRF